MAHVPDKPNDPSPNRLMAGRLDSIHTTPPPVQNQHLKRFATRCNHELHPSASSHTPYCPTCVLHTAQAKLEGAQAMVTNAGGLDCSWESRDRDWANARFVYYLAWRSHEQARKMDQLRWEREHAWDEAHLRTKFELIDKGMQLDEQFGCSVCSSVIPNESQVFGNRVDKSLAWWDRPGALELAPTTEPKTPIRSRFAHEKREPRRSPSMRSIIHGLRTALLTATSEQQIWETRYKTESAVRRKHGLGVESQFEPTFWDSPVSGLTVKDNYRQALVTRRMAERRARGNMPRPRPPRSSLSYCESAEAIVVDEDLKEAMRIRQAADELERMEREARRVGEEVGYLYFVGAVDGLEEWKEDVLKSKPHLVWRDYGQSGEGVYQNEMV